MAIDPITAVLNIGGSIIDRLIPDKNANAKAKADLIQAELNGELEAAKGQLSVDLAEASNQSVFVSGWRPFVGWVCGAAFAYVYILQPFLQFFLVAFKINFDPNKLPVVDTSQMIPVLLGMLGLGAMRSFDKTNTVGTDTDVTVKKK